MGAGQISGMVVAELMSGQRLLRDLDSGELLDEKGQRTGTPTIVDSRHVRPLQRPERRAGEGQHDGVGFRPVLSNVVDTIIEVKI